MSGINKYQVRLSGGYKRRVRYIRANTWKEAKARAKKMYGIIRTVRRVEGPGDTTGEERGEER